MTDKKSMLREAVNQLVTYHQDVNQILSEAQSIYTDQIVARQDDIKRECEEIGSVYKQCLSTSLKEFSELKTAETCAKRLIEIISEIKNLGDTDVSIMESKMQSHIQMVNVMMKQQYFNRPRFLNILCNEVCLPIMVLCYLNKEDVMSLESYFKFKSKDPKFIQVFGEELIHCCSKNSTDFNETLSLLVYHSFPEKLESEAMLKKICSSILLWILHHFLHLAGNSKNTTVELTLVPRGNMICSEISLKKYCSFLIQNILVYDPVHNVKESMSEQKNWKYAKLSVQLLEMYKQILAVTEAHNLIEITKLTLESEGVNWYNCCSLWSTFLVCFGNSSTIAEEFLTDILKTGFEESNADLITRAFLIGRQCCQEGTHVFISYQDWFQALFGDSARSMCTSKKTFATLIKVLTDLVPFESPSCLKVHILRPPFVPPKCKELLADYVILAKTRLADLKEPLEQVGVFEVTDSSSSSKFQNQIEEDVQKALAAFETNNKMPSAVMEASIFRKSYFLGKFLPALLKPRPLPDIPDIRMKFIEALKKVEKIPPNMYKTYGTGCRKEAENLLQGVFIEIDGDEDDDIEMTLSALEQFNHRITQMMEKIIKKQTKNYVELISVLKDRINCLVGQPEDIAIDRKLRFNLDKPQLNATHLKVVDGILNLFSKVSPICLTVDKPDCSWAAQVVDMLSDLRILHKPLYVRILKLCFNQADNLEDHHITGLALLLAYFSIKSASFGEVELSSCNSDFCRRSQLFPEKLWTLIPMNSSEQMITTLKLMSAYLYCVFIVVDHSCLMEEDFNRIYPQVLIQKFLFLSRRLLPEVREEKGQQRSSSTELRIAVYVNNSDQFKEISKSIYVSFEDWINMEISINPNRDLLSDFERQEYLYETIYTHYLPKEKLIGGCGQDYRYTSSVILKTIVQSDLRSDGSKNMYCQACFQKNNGTRSRVYFVQVLQELCWCLSTVTPETGDNKPWLLSQLKLLTSGEKDEQTSEAIVKTFFRTVCCLPRYLYFTDLLRDPVPDIDLVVSIINWELKEAFCCGCTLPMNILLYLVQAVLEVQCHVNVDEVFQKCPILVISILVYLPNVKHLVNQISFGNTNITLVISWLSRALDDSIEEFIDNQPWMLSAALLSLYINRGSIDFLSQMVSQNEPSVNAVLGEFVMMLTAQFSSEDMKLTQALDKLHYICPTVLLTIPKQSYTQQISSTFTLHMVPYRLLLYLSNRLVIRDYLEDSRFLNLILKWFSQVFNHQRSPKEDLLCEVELSSFVKSCINSSPHHIVVELDQKLVIQCGVDVILAVGERLKRP